MKKLILLLIAVTTMISGCSMFGTMFSESRNNFDEKIDRIDAYLKTQDCKLTEHSSYFNSEKNYYDMGNEQFIIEYIGGDTRRTMESRNHMIIKNGIVMGGNIMSNQMNKGKMYLTIEVAISKDKEEDYHIDSKGKEIRELTLTYDGKPIVLKDKTDYGSYLYGNQQFIYSDIKIMKEIAQAKEIKIEGRSAAGRKVTRTLTNDDLVLFKKMLNVVQEVNSILNNK